MENTGQISMKETKNYKGEVRQIWCIGTNHACQDMLEKWGVLQGMSHGAEMALVWSETRPGRYMLGEKWPPTTCQMFWEI